LNLSRRGAERQRTQRKSNEREHEMKKILTVVSISIVTSLFAAGPGGNPPGGGGNQPGGNQPGQPGGGSSATFTFDTFLAASTATSGVIIREGVITGHESPTADIIQHS